MASFPSPFNHVLRTNYAPSPDELTAIRKLISGPEEKIRLLNQKISELQAERDNLQSFVDDHRALLSPARRLPRDVVAEMFLRCLPTARLPTCDVTTSPLLLTTICRSWRDVAITTPRLWRAVHFVLPTLIGHTIHHDFRNLVRIHKGGLQLWLCRAGSVPLTISCYAPVDDPKPQNVREELQTVYTEYLEIVSRYSAQWQALYLSHVPQELLSPIRVLSASDVPLLRTLSLNMNGCDFARPWMSSSEENSLLNLMKAPSLRALHLRREWGEPITFPVHWRNLTELSMSSVSTSLSIIELISTLGRTCQSLRKCDLELKVSQLDNHLSVCSPRQTWQYLTELRIHLGLAGIPLESVPHSNQILQTVLDSISTPALSHLALTIPLRNVVAEHAPFLGLVQVSNCIITSLELNMHLSSGALVEALQCVPSISTLHLTDVFQPPPYVTEEGVVIRPSPVPILESDVFRALADNELCPSLENVTLKLCPIERIDDVVAFALGRRTIKSLNVTFQMNDGVGNRRYGRLLDEEQEKGELIKRHGIKVEWHNTGFEGGFPGPLNNPMSSVGMPPLLSGIY